MTSTTPAAARDTAAAVTEALTARDRLTLVAFDSMAEPLLEPPRWMRRCAGPSG
jgi:hypothetical protein